MKTTTNDHRGEGTAAGPVRTRPAADPPRYAPRRRRAIRVLLGLILAAAIASLVMVAVGDPAVTAAFGQAFAG